MRQIVLLVVSVLMVSQSLFAESLKDKKWMSYEDEHLKEEVDATDTRCGFKLKASIDWGSFVKNKPATEGFSVSGYCSHGLEALRLLCDDDASKAEVVKKVKSYKCEFGGKGKRAAKFAGGTITTVVDFEASNGADFFKGKLEELL